VGKERLSIVNCLVPIGGGKDSAVTLEVLRPLRERTCAYTINARAAQRDTCAAAGLPPERLLDARRTIDPNLLRLNAEGFLNGHTPFSAVVAFSSVLCAYLHGLEHVALSNESSANESTVPGSTVNHQYSKSYAFERDFRAYERAYLRSGVHYFSLLRPLSEYDIARLFAHYPAYHPVFRSCNAGSKTDSWCGHCPKCLFVWLILSPFLSRAALTEIFGRDLSADETLTPLLEQLTGIQPEKPFECVGSRAEVNYALRQTVDSLLAQGRELPPLYAHWYTIAGNCPVSPPPELDSEHFVPELFLELLKKEVARCGSSSAR
jgi:hypothetical protein